MKTPLETIFRGNRFAEIAWKIFLVLFGLAIIRELFGVGITDLFHKLW